MKHFYASLLLSCLLTPAIAAAQTPDLSKANIFHAFDWKFEDIEAELDRIADAGYGAVQVSPVQGNCGVNAEWFYAYLPYDIGFKANGNGSATKLRQLTAAAKEKGIDIIVDVVSNHINPQENYRASWWNTNASTALRSIGKVRYNNRRWIHRGQLGDYPDVVSEDAGVQERMVAFLIKLRDSYGITGIRWDAAKHIALPSEDCAYWTKATELDGLWHYGEILDNPDATTRPNDWTLLREYATLMSVTDNGYSRDARNAFLGKNVPSATGGHTLSSKAGISGDKVVYWGESHDEYCNETGETKNVSQEVIDITYAFLACRDKETALYFSRPAKKAYADIKMGVKGSVNGLENPMIVAVNQFRKAMSGKADCVSNANSVASVTRQGGGAVIFNPKRNGTQVTAVNGNGYLPAGEYTDIVSGGKFTATATTITGTPGTSGVAVLVVGNSLAVDDISADSMQDTTPVYFDLQGRQVQHPASGVYIRKTGSKVDKVIL